MRDGQSFAIAGLLHNTAQEDGSKVPILGSIPIIGNLFKSKSERKEQTELMVLITPQLVRPLDPDEVPTLPMTTDRFLQPDPKKGGLMDAPSPQPAVAPSPAAPIKKDEGK